MLAATAIGPTARIATRTWALSRTAFIAVDARTRGPVPPRGKTPVCDGIWPSSPALGEHAVEGVDVEVGGLDVDAQRRLGLEDVRVVPGRLDDHAVVEHALADRRGLGRRRFE